MTQPAPGMQREQEKEMSKSNNINAHFLKAVSPVSLPIVLLLFDFVTLILCVIVELMGTFKIKISFKSF